MSLLFPGNWQRCDCVPISTSTRQVSPVITEHFPPLSHLVISHQPWAGVMDHPAQLCSGKQGMFLSTSQGEWPGFGSLHSHGASGEGPVGRDPRGGTHGRSQRCPMYHAGCRTALPRDGPVLLGNWNSEEWEQVSSPCAILYFHIPAFLFALLVKWCHPIFHGLAAKAVEVFLSCFFFSSSKTFIIQFTGEADNEQHKFNLVLTPFKSKIWIYT